MSPNFSPWSYTALASLLSAAAGWLARQYSDRRSEKWERAKAVEDLIETYQIHAVRYWAATINDEERKNAEREIKNLRDKIGGEITRLKKRLWFCKMTRSSQKLVALHKAAAGSCFECWASSINFPQEDARATKVQKLARQLTQALRDDLGTL